MSGIFKPGCPCPWYDLENTRPAVFELFGLFVLLRRHFPDSRLKDVAKYTNPILNYSLEAVSPLRPQAILAEWLVIWCFFLFTRLLCAMCACEAMVPRMYPVSQYKTATAKTLTLLVTPTATPHGV